MAGTLKFLYDDGQWSMAQYPSIYGRMQWRSMADVQRRLERGFFFAMGSRGPVQVSIVGPSQDSQPLILNPLAARIRCQAPIYRF